MICKWRIFVFFCCRAAGSEQQVIECFCQRSLLLRLVVVHWLSQYFRLGGLAVIFHRLAQLQGFFGLALERHMVKASTAATPATAARPHVFCISRTQMVAITALCAEWGGISSASAVSRAV